MLQPAPTPSVLAVRSADEPNLVTTQEAARICGVHASTVKRWCDAGDLPCRLTAGGHRRIVLAHLVDFSRGEGVVTSLEVFGPELDAVWRAGSKAADGHFDAIVGLWFRWLMADEAPLLHPSLTLLLDKGLDLALVLDRGVGRLMQRIGAAWEEGRIRIGDEHRASEHIMDALHLLRSGLTDRRSVAPGARRAIVGAAEGDIHQLGAFMVRLVLEDKGFVVSYLGANVPGEEFAAQQLRWDADLVCASFSAPRGTADAVRLVRNLAQSYDAGRPFHLILGGNALSGKPVDFPYLPFRSYAVLGSLGELSRRLDDLREDADLPPSTAATSAATAEQPLTTLPVHAGSSGSRSRP